MENEEAEEREVADDLVGAVAEEDELKRREQGQPKNRLNHH